MEWRGLRSVLLNLSYSNPCTEMARSNRRRHRNGTPMRMKLALPNFRYWG